ncbi:MAG: COG1361 S-layer family protein [Candidatus Nanoarchaeia archaeon]
MKINNKHNKHKQQKSSMNVFIKNIIALLSILALLSFSFAELELKNIYTDPAIISAGDEVDIVIEYQALNTPFESNQVGSQEYEFRANLILEDDISKDHITLLDSEGISLKGSVLRGVTYNKVFRIKVSPDAPSATYQLKLEGQWYKNNQPLETKQIERFDLNVKKEGILLDVASFETQPSKIRPGDDSIQLTTYIENSGFKDAKSIELQLQSNTDLITPSYSDNNRKYIGLVENATSKPVSFTIDLDEDLKPGVHTLNAILNYRDLDNNQYYKNISIPLLVDSRPNIEVISVEGDSRVGEESQMRIVVQNTGQDTAEAVDVRIIKESSQPFSFDIRSNYIGELEPNETGIAVFDINTLSSAEEKTHNFQLLIRAQGDREKGDSSIYTFYDRAEFEVSGQSINWFIIIGAGVVVLVIILFIITRIKMSSSKKREDKNKK